VTRLDFAGAVSLVAYMHMIEQRTMRALFPDARHSAERFALIFKISLIANWRA